MALPQMPAYRGHLILKSGLATKSEMDLKSFVWLEITLGFIYFHPSNLHCLDKFD
ncbi:hypothetical protein [Burkholderia gladioli]|uniref:hypothetical protein n=1 Tax=Burkholderia gladioli TaxID=28095 RepID=UPI000A69918E|nr:hypothetical protein [Burkholderia gladioli]